MAYTEINFKTEKALKEAVLAGRTITCYNPGPWPLEDGAAVIEGPHYPEPHRWYARVEVKNRKIVKFLG